MQVTAVVPCFNNARTLPEVLSSISAQTVTIQEVLVVDDGSHDGSDKIAEEIGCRIIRNTKNLGRGATRARAIVPASTLRMTSPLGKV